MVKINYSDNKNVKFGALSSGEFFIYDGTLHVKAYRYKSNSTTPSHFSVEIESGMEHLIPNATEVESVDVEINVI